MKKSLFFIVFAMLLGFASAQVSCILNDPTRININVSNPLQDRSNYGYQVQARNGSGSMTPQFNSSCIVNGCMNFTGQSVDSNYLFTNFSQDPSGSCAANFSISLWMLPLDYGSQFNVLTIWAQDVDSSSDIGALRYDNFSGSNGLIQVKDVGAGGWTTIAAGVAPNTFHHIVGVYNATGFVLFVDGVFKGYVPGICFILGGGQELDFGANSLGAAFGSNPFEGLIDEIHVFNYSITSTDILQLYNFERDGTGIPASCAVPQQRYQNINQSEGLGSTLNVVFKGTGQVIAGTVDNILKPQNDFLSLFVGTAIISTIIAMFVLFRPLAI